MSTVPQPATIRYPLRSLSDRRGAERFDARMPMVANGHEGTTLDLSTTGVAFASSERFELGARIEVVIDYLLDGHNYPLRTEAEVMRVEPGQEGGYIIGARLCGPFGA